MMKHILSVQDLSCVGRCSLTVAMPVLSAMGLRCSVLPTAVLSTHTAFPSPEAVSLTGHLTAFADHWNANGIGFDGISVGYLSDPEQAEVVLDILDKFPCPVILDPVMGDGGKLYRRITAEHVSAMGALCAKADVVLPNVTEAAALAGLPYREDGDEVYLAQLASGVLSLGAKNVVITGIRWNDRQIGWYYSDGITSHAHRADLVPRSFHGTGDLFAAVFAGAYLHHKDIIRSAAMAAEFVRRCAAATGESTPHGVEFETQLPWLMQANCK